MKKQEPHNLLITDAQVMEKIYRIRGQKIMLDRDLAVLYNYETKRLNEQVRRNRTRFPKNFMFQLTKEEVEALRSQFATANISSKMRALPYAFTEHGLLMLANVLKSDTAVKISIHIIEVFVKMREMILTPKDILLKLKKMENTLSTHDLNIKKLYDYIKAFITEEKKPRKTIGFKMKSK